jgi:ethanolamine-phosphate cytidylyltransferase
MALSCKHVDDVVIGAPFILTQDLINSLHISVVAEIVGTEEDKVLKRYQTIDPHKVAREQGILRQV